MLNATFKNYTPHTVSVYNNDTVWSIKSEGVPVRVNEEVTLREPISGFPVVTKEYTTIEGLPPEEDEVILIVSVIVLQASDRTDLVCPDTGPDSAVRDSGGRILGVKRFQCKL